MREPPWRNQGDGESPAKRQKQDAHAAVTPGPFSATSRRPFEPSLKEKDAVPQGRDQRKTAHANGRVSFRERAAALLPSRRALPIWPHADAIRAALRRTDVLVLAGETGSGKSTQVPQFLLSEAWCNPRTATLANPSQDAAPTRVEVGGCIAVTEPRRVAAVTLARRVAEEMGTPLGAASPASRVGYSVRFDTSVGPSTRIKFLTEGMLLQEMLRDPALRRYSAVVVDEVHERAVNVDLILGFLRRLATEGAATQRGGVPLKVVVMSATADVEGLKEYFEKGYRCKSTLSETQKDNSEHGDLHSESGSEWSGLPSDEDKAPQDVSTKDHVHGSANGKSSKNQAGFHQSNGQSHQANGRYSLAGEPLSNVSVCRIKGRQYPVQILYSPEPVNDLLDASLTTILRIHTGMPLPGDILVFLTGQEAIESLHAILVEHAATLPPTVPKLLPLPLFAALPAAAQQAVFQPAPAARTRKVVLATNLAETAVTVPGVRHVVDGGKCKLRLFRPSLGLDSLLVKPVSRAAAAQRAGRAGREAPGTCHRLYTAATFEELPADNQPEMLRCDLARAVLDLKARGVANVLAFPFISAPPRPALEKALAQLLRLGALDPATGDITSVGRALAALPLSVSLGRALVAAATTEPACLAETLDVVACLSVENVFPPAVGEEARERVAEARRGLLRRSGDHLTLLAALRGYAAEASDRKAWAARHGCAHRALRAALDVRKQLRALVAAPGAFAAGFDFGEVDDARAVPPATGDAVLRAVLRGFVGNTARLCPDGAYRVLGRGARSQGHTVAIHPSSVLFGRKVEAIVFGEWVFTNRSYARAVSAVRADWIAEAFEGQPDC